MRISNFFSKKNYSKDSRVLISNFGYLSLLQISSYFFPFITIPYLSKTLGVDGFGKIAFAAAIIVWFQTIADWGFNYTATRDVAKYRDDLNKVSEIFSNVLWSRLLLVIVSLLILCLLILFIPKFKDNYAILLITFIIVPGQVFFPDWFFQAMEKMKYITVLNISSKIFFTINIFFLIKNKEDFILQPLIISFGYIFSGIIAMYLILVKWKIKLQPPNINSILNAIRNSSNVFFNNFVPNLYNSLSVVILGFFGSASANGILDAGSKFVKIGQEFMYVLSRTFYPFLSRRIDKHNLYVKINLSFAFIVSLSLFLLAPTLIRLFFTVEFLDSILILRIMALSIFFLALSNVYGTNYMIIQGHERELRNITIVCSLIGFFISFPLIYYYDVIGAAITITCSRLILGISIAKKSRKFLKNNN